MDRKVLVSRIMEEVVKRRFALIMCVALPLTVSFTDSFRRGREGRGGNGKRL